MKAPRAHVAAPRPARFLLTCMMALAMAVTVAVTFIGPSPSSATQVPGGLFIIRKVILNQPGNTTSTFSGTLVKAQGNQLIGSFSTLAQGSPVYFPGLANGTYIVTETDSSLAGYWSSPGDVSCPAQPSTDPNQDRGQINIPTDIVTVCVYNGAQQLPTLTPSSTVAPSPTPGGNVQPTPTRTPFPTPIAPSTGHGDGAAPASRSPVMVLALLALVTGAGLAIAGRRS